MFHYLNGNHLKSLEMAKKESNNVSSIFSVNATFYECLATSALAWTLKSFKRRSHVNHCRKLAKQMRKWADRCPENFRNKQLLMDAEIAGLTGKFALACRLYEDSVSKAKHEEFLHEEGIAYERLGFFQLYRADVAGAARSFEHARAAFDHWGATMVVDRIETILKSIVPMEVGVEHSRPRYPTM